MMNSRGRFISFEGGEGGGKTTQAKKLIAALESIGISTIHTREPGGEDGAEEIRKLLVTGDSNRWEPISETLLFLAARVQHVKRVIEPAIADGKWVICDRFHDSTIVYQGAQGVSNSYYQMLHSATLGNILPDITFLLDMEVNAGLNRSFARDNSETRFEEMNISFHQSVRNGFLKLAKQEPSRFSVIDATQDIGNIHTQIITDISNRFELAFKA